MSDREKFTSQSFPKSWEDQPAFREIFLVHLPPHLAESCQRLGEHVFTALLEANMSDADPDDLVRGVAADLYHRLDLEQHHVGEWTWEQGPASLPVHHGIEPRTLFDAL